MRIHATEHGYWFRLAVAQWKYSNQTFKHSAKWLKFINFCSGGSVTLKSRVSRLTTPSYERSFEHKIPAAEKALSAFYGTCWFSNQKIKACCKQLPGIPLVANTVISVWLQLIAVCQRLSVVSYDRLITCEGGHCAALFQDRLQPLL